MQTGSTTQPTAQRSLTLIPLPVIPGGRSWRRLLSPPRERDHRAHRLELSWQNSLGMTILGLIGLLYALACCAAVWLGALPGGSELLPFGLTMGGSGVAALVVARRHPRVARGLAGLLLVGLGVAAGLSTVGPSAGGAGLSPLTSTAAQVPLLLVLTVSLVAFRPLQVAALAALSSAATLGGALLGPAGWWTNDGLAGLALYSGVLSLGAVAFGSLLYHLRWSIVDRRLELLANQQYLQRRASELEQDNARLRSQRGSALDAAQSSRSQSIASLAAGIAHEVNTPIGSIQANIDVIARAVANLRERLHEESCPAIRADRKVSRSLRVLDETVPVTREALGRVNHVVEQLKSFSHLDRAQRTPVNLHEGLDSALSLIQFRLGERVAVIKHYASDLPRVEVDAERLYQVFMNLLCNAVQAIDTAAPGMITVSTSREGDEVVVRISDSGSGIAKEHLARIFEPGFTTRLHHAGAGVIGMGLGLAISRRVVEAHDGTLALDSTPGRGTTATVRLPLA